jgi:hypothetical protein
MIKSMTGICVSVSDGLYSADSSHVETAIVRNRVMNNSNDL